MRASWLGYLFCCATSTALAADIVVSVTDQRGKPVADAVVTVVPDGPAPPRTAAPVTRTIDQSSLVFVPYIEIFRPGDRVVFRNSDATRHHVYSFSKVKAFEFVLRPGESSPPLALDAPGVIAAGCNIHDSMISYLFVSDAPWVARSDAGGMARLPALPRGSFQVQAWHPRLRPGKAAPAQALVVADDAGKPLGFRLTLLPDSRHRPGQEPRAY
jgi:plastocyanin